MQMMISDTMAVEIKDTLEIAKSPIDIFLGVDTRSGKWVITWTIPFGDPDLWFLFDHEDFDYEGNAPEAFRGKKYFLEELSSVLYSWADDNTEEDSDDCEKVNLLASFYESISANI